MNARFGVASPETARYQVVQVRVKGPPESDEGEDADERDEDGDAEEPDEDEDADEPDGDDD